MMALAKEMGKVARELNLTAGVIQNEAKIRATQTSISGSITSSLGQNIAPLITTTSMKGWTSLYNETGNSSHECGDDVFTADAKPSAPSTQTLHSLHATTNVEERKSNVILLSLKIIGKEHVVERKDVPVLPQHHPSCSIETTSCATPSSVKPLLQDVTTAKEGSSGGASIEKQQKILRRVRRTMLPAQQSPSERISFAALGRMILQRTGVPISHYEPLTALQLLCEELRFSKLLDNACNKSTAEERMVYVAAFALSSYSNSTGRFRKFFNPLLGETYEYEENDFRYLGEQVSHHPPVSAGHATGNGWTWYQTFSAEITWNTWAQTCEFAPDRPVRLQLHGEEYSWNKITTHIENLLCIPEQRKLFHEGTIHVRCSNGVAARINVKKNKDVSGEVTNSNGKTFCRLFGKWDEEFSRLLESGERENLIVVSSSALHPQYFGFSDFTMGLNELLPEEEPLLPPTDSRLRPDVRNLENGALDKAVEYKQELEKAQRMRAINEETYKPLWFEEKNDDFTKKKMFVSTGKYWKAKQTKFEQQKKENAFIPIFKVSITT